MQGGYKEIVIFDQYLAISPKRYDTAIVTMECE